MNQNIIILIKITNENKNEDTSNFQTWYSKLEIFR